MIRFLKGSYIRMPMGEDDYRIVASKVLSEVQRVKGLEERIGDSIPSEEPELKKAITASATPYFAGEYRKILEQYGGGISGKPEEAYLKALIEAHEGGPGGMRKRVLDMEIRESGLPKRIVNALKNRVPPVYYIGELVQLSEPEARRVPNLGNGSINNIKSYLQEHHLEFGMDIRYSPPAKK
jgi:DNA-directed RNA polymerase alpha subunit